MVPVLEAPADGDTGVGAPAEPSALLSVRDVSIGFGGLLALDAV